MKKKKLPVSRPLESKATNNVSCNWSTILPILLLTILFTSIKQWGYKC